MDVLNELYKNSAMVLPHKYDVLSGVFRWDKAKVCFVRLALLLSLTRSQSLSRSLSRSLPLLTRVSDNVFLACSRVPCT